MGLFNPVYCDFCDSHFDTQLKFCVFQNPHQSTILLSSNVLQRQLVKAKGLEFPESVVSFPGLGIGMMVASDQVDKKLPATHKPLKTLYV